MNIATAPKIIETRCVSILHHNKLPESMQVSSFESVSSKNKDILISQPLNQTETLHLQRSVDTKIPSAIAENIFSTDNVIYAIKNLIT